MIALLFELLQRDPPATFGTLNKDKLAVLDMLKIVHDSTPVFCMDLLYARKRMTPDIDGCEAHGGYVLLQK